MNITPDQSDLATRATILGECWLLGYLVNQGRIERGLDPLDDKYTPALADTILREMARYDTCDDLSYTIRRALRSGFGGYA